MKKTRVLLTGASGLLGTSLVDVFLKNGFEVAGQYFSNRPADRHHCFWLQGDLGSRDGIRRFLRQHNDVILQCDFLVNNYGPLTFKATGDLSIDDFLEDYFHNLAPAVEITRFLLPEGNLESVVNIGFEFAGEMKSYKKILPYAAAKNALWLLTLSYAEAFKPVRFNMVSPVTIDGAELPSPNNKRVAPEMVAEKVLRVITGSESGSNFVI
jgi:NAD(P)-dependent dehydrogenase (short-subunit alcohol dehydrogenase family)